MALGLGSCRAPMWKLGAPRRVVILLKRGSTVRRRRRHLQEFLAMQFNVLADTGSVAFPVNKSQSTTPSGRSMSRNNLPLTIRRQSCFTPEMGLPGTVRRLA